MIHKTIGGAAAGMMLLILNPGPASAQDGSACSIGTAESQAAPKPKKKGFGLGGLLKAARDAGVGDLLGSGDMLGTGKAGRIVGAVAGTAVSSASGDGQGGAGLSGQVAGLAGSGRVARLAGALTGTAAQLARSAPAEGRTNDGAAKPPCGSQPAAASTEYR